MAVKIRLKRLGKVRVPQYRIVVVDSRKKRDGRVIEEIGKYHPKEDPSYIDVVSDRAQYWLGVGAQPTEAVAAILKITGDWQKFRGEPGAEGTLKVAEPKRDKLEIFNEALKDAAKRAQGRRGDQEGRQEGREGRGRQAGRGRGARRGGAAGRGAPAAEAAGAEAPAEVPTSETPEGAAEEAEADREGHGRGRRQERA